MKVVGSASLTSQTSRKRLSPLEPAAPAAKQFPTFREFLDRKSEERRDHFKQSKKAKQASCEVTINVALMEYDGAHNSTNFDQNERTMVKICVVGEG